MEDISLQVEVREVLGKKTRFLRRQGVTPANIYGAGMESRPIQVDSPTLRRVLVQAGMNVLVNVLVEGEKDPYTTFVREAQRHPVSGELLHVDFYKVDLSQPIVSEVPVVLIGEAPAEKLRGGVVTQYLNQVTVESLPASLPREFSVDISGLEEIDQAIYGNVLPQIEGVTILTGPEELLVRINLPRVVAERAGAETEEEAAEAEVGESGTDAEVEAGDEE